MWKLDGFARRKERIKESIMNAAIELFRAYGFKKVSINEIAAKANVSPVSIYNHFDSKQELMKSVLKKILEGIYERQRSILTADVPYWQKMQNMLSAKMNAAYEFQGEHFQTEIYNDPEIKGFIHELMATKIYKLVSDFFDEGKAEGYINPEISQQSIMTFIEVFQQGWGALSNLPKDPAHLSKMINDMQMLTLYGLMGKPSDKPKFATDGKGN
ncbi:TetR/AcrR family transcriptional regulator [Chloroflexota bacterium]